MKIKKVKPTEELEETTEELENEEGEDTEESAGKEPKKEVIADIGKLLRSIRKTTNSNSFKHSQYGTIKNYISTGDYGLNRIISGSIYKGVPSGRIVLINGESCGGKSLFVAQIAANALNIEKYDMIFYFDSEGGALEEFFKSRRCDTDKIEHILVDNLEDAHIKIIDTYSKVMSYKESNSNAKFLFILDSLGALVTSKVTKDATIKKKVVSEMGGRSKLCLASDTLVLMSNNEYKQIKDIQKGDKVITHLGKIKEIRDNFKSKHTNYIKIKCNNQEIKLSLNHRLLISRNNQLQYIEAKDIKTTDKLIQLNIE
jgi:RecA/RadA recombinase